jgi:hypothetical protein
VWTKTLPPQIKTGEIHLLLEIHFQGQAVAPSATRNGHHFQSPWPWKWWQFLGAVGFTTRTWKSARTINPTNAVQNSNQLLPPRDTHGGRTVMAEGGPAKIFMKIKGGGLLISLEVGVDSYRM